MSSSMLEQAVIDAQALKEAAVKNAEQEVLEKYSGEIKEAVNSLLEQEDPMAMDPMAAPPMMAGATVDPLAAPASAKAVDAIAKDIPLKALDSLGINNMKDGDEIDLDLDALVKSVNFGHPEDEEQPSKPELMFEATESDLYNLLDEELIAEDDEDYLYEEPVPATPPLTLDPNELADQMGIASVKTDEDGNGDESAATRSLYEDDDESLYEDEGEESLESPLAEDDGEVLDEDENLDEDYISQAIDEILKVDLENVPRGMAGTTHPTKLEQEYAVAIAAAAAQDTERKEQNKEFEEAVKQIVTLEEHVKSLKSGKNRLAKEHKELKSVARQVSDKLTELNIANAKLVYQNRILESHSLNERQKDKLVEAVSNANSIEEAKVIYETLQDSLSSEGARAPQNLNEAVSKNNRLVLKSNNKETQVSDSAFERMKRLAGII